MGLIIQELEAQKAILEKERDDIQQQIEDLYDKMGDKSEQINEIDEQIDAIKFKDIVFVPGTCYYTKNPAPGYHDWEETLYLIKGIMPNNPKYVDVVEYQKRCADDDKFLRVEKCTCNCITLSRTLTDREAIKIAEEDKEKYLKIFTYLD